MSKLRSINTSIWTDIWFEELDTNSKLLFIYLITNEKTNMLGVYEISKRKISFETGIPISNIDKSFKIFQEANKIKYQSGRVVLLKYLKHQNYNLNMKKSAIDCYNELPEDLKMEGISHLSRDEKGFETLYNGFLSIRKVEVEKETEVEVEKEEEKKDPSPKKLTKKEAEEAFIKWFNDRRARNTGKKSNIKALSDTDINNLHKLRAKYNGKDFDIAFTAMCKNQWAKDNNMLVPSHFLVNNNFIKYHLKGQDMKQESTKTLKEIIKNQYHG